MRAFAILLAVALIVGCGGSAPEKTEEETEQPQLYRLAETTIARFHQHGYRKLTQPEKVLLCVWGLDEEVTSGGLEQFYYNEAGDRALDTAEALQAIGATNSADLIRQANALFGPLGPSTDQAQRQKQLEGLSADHAKRLAEITEQFSENEENLEELLDAYVNKRLKDFPPR